MHGVPASVTSAIERDSSRYFNIRFIFLFSLSLLNELILDLIP